MRDRLRLERTGGIQRRESVMATQRESESAKRGRERVRESSEMRREVQYEKRIEKTGRERGKRFRTTKGARRCITLTTCDSQADE